MNHKTIMLLMVDGEVVGMKVIEKKIPETEDATPHFQEAQWFFY